MTDVTLSGSGTTVTIQATKVDWDYSKEWKINKIPATLSTAAYTSLASPVTSGDASIVVTLATNFREKDKIMIDGFDAAGAYHQDECTIDTISTTTFTLQNNVGNSYVTANSRVTKEGRLISLDFGKGVESFTIHGILVASATRNVGGVVGDLQFLSKYGGSINLFYGGKNFAEMAVTKANITEEVEDQGAGTVPSQYGVILN